MVAYFGDFCLYLQKRQVKNPGAKISVLQYKVSYAAHFSGPFNHNVRDYTGKYWFGFRAVDNSSSLFFWTGCEETTYDTPLVQDFTTQGECVFLWIQREVFVNTFQDKWFYGQSCSDKVPFICSLMVPGKEYDIYHTRGRFSLI